MISPKPFISIFILSVILAFNITGQTTIVINPTEDAIISSYNPTGNYGSHSSFKAERWTISGTGVTIRALMKINLSSVPSNAIIVSAKLYLYSAGDHLMPNKCFIKRTTTSWTESAVTWNTGVGVITDPETVTLEESLSAKQDYLADITTMVNYMRATPSYGNGLMLFLNDEVTNYKRMSFYSSDYSDVNKKPKVEITYVIPGTKALSTNQNYIYTSSSEIPLQSVSSTGWKNPFNYNENVEYFDGLGRSVQAIDIAASPSGKDIILPKVYDNLGREDKKYLPYVTSVDDGSYHSYAVGTGDIGGTAANGNYYSEQGTFYRNGSLSGVEASSYAGSQTIYDNSPLNRVTQQGYPGDCWQPYKSEITNSGHTSKYEYTSNITNEVKIWNYNGSFYSTGCYEANSLYVTIFKNENWTNGDLNTTREYKDKEGKIVLKRTFVEGANGTVNELNTYYVYNDFNLLIGVITPEAYTTMVIPTSGVYLITAPFISHLCYKYSYDERKRLIIKELPGAAPVYLAYDNRDRLVLTQDGKMRAENSKNCLFTKYDELNRPVVTGIFTSVSNITSQTDLQTLVNNYYSSANNVYYVNRDASQTIGYSNTSFPNTYYGSIDYLTATFYDTYGFPGQIAFNSKYNVSGYLDAEGASTMYFEQVKNQITGTKSKVLISTSLIYLTSTNYYDDKYRLIQTSRDLYDGSATSKEIISNKFDFSGKVLKSLQTQTFNNTTTSVEKYFTYDHAGRLSKTELQVLGDVNNGLVKTSENNYNQLGQLIDKKLHKGIQSIDYWYNIRGWLKQINNISSLSNDGTGDTNPDLFAMNLYYNKDINGNNTSEYSGNISNLKWVDPDNTYWRTYNFSYDKLNRLKESNYEQYGLSAGTTAFEEKGITYDLNGNIKTLKRTNSAGTETAYIYNYRNSNKSNLLDNINGQLAYDYDNNGNTILDGLRNMGITYNYLNLPSSIYKSESIEFIYSASGEKLFKKLKNGTYNYYASNFVYKNDKTIDYILFDEGRIAKPSGAYQYEYSIKDHLGSTRVVFAPNGNYTTTLQTTNYYPFGSVFSNQTSSIGNKYLYNGKEIHDDVLYGTTLGWYDYGARFYDPQIGRFTTEDPKAEKFLSTSPYAYCGDNPIRRIDKDGKVWTDANGKELTNEQRNKVKVYIFYDKDFSKQTMKMYNNLIKQYGKGSVALSMVSTASSFAKDWGNMSSKDIKAVDLNVHGSNQQLHLDYKTNEYVTSTGTGKTSSMGNPATNIKDLPQPEGDVSKAQLNINSCHSNDKNDSDMPLKGDKKTVAESFQENFDFKNVRSTSGAVNYNSSGEPTTQWYYLDFWQNSEDEK